MAKNEKTGHFDFSDEIGTKRATTEEQNCGVFKFSTIPKPITTEQLAKKLTNRETSVSRVTITKRLGEKKVRWEPLV